MTHSAVINRAGTPLDEDTETAIFGAMHAYSSMQGCDCVDDDADCKHARAYRLARDRLRNRFLEFTAAERKRCATVVRSCRHAEEFPVQRRLLREVALLVEKAPTS